MHFTMEKMLWEGLMGHELGNKQSLMSFTATANQVCKPLTPQLPHQSRFILIPNHTIINIKVHNGLIYHRMYIKLHNELNPNYIRQGKVNRLNTIKFSNKLIKHIELASKQNYKTMNWWVSGQADLLKRLTAIQRPSSSIPLYTTLGAFSPCSDTMWSTENPEVAALSWSKLYSRN